MPSQLRPVQKGPCPMCSMFHHNTFPLCLDLPVVSFKSALRLNLVKIPYLTHVRNTAFPSGSTWIYNHNYTVCLQINGAVWKVNKKFISHLTRAKPTPSAAANVQVSHALPAVRFSCLLHGPRSPSVSTSERTAGSAWETWTVAAADGVGLARVRWEINFLLSFETAPFICKHPVFRTNNRFNGIGRASLR